ncbi:hypothetical protein K431DRAFT_281393 [Polychaeton citri CBS 116435]|uniref:Uncharacterized protein n=1 Tax=Polychaeton citri CBS 116435 TaxID=1314669 RepID=A0A9P4UU89_9PEZI|nr:hypothetical protein K431DRAFT_281393 [Polychaeton citri CBS 116435]
MKYVDISNPMGVRQAALNESYFFDCKCTKCARGAIHQEDVFDRPAEQLKDEWKDKARFLLGKWEKLPKDFPKFQLGDTLPERYLAAIQAEAFAYAGVDISHDAGAWHGSLGEAQHALQMCIGTGLWPLHRQPVPHLLRQIFSTYLSIGDHYRAFRVGLKLHFEITPKLQPERFYPDRVIDTWSMHTLANQLASPQNEDIFTEFLAAGVDLRDVYFMFLYEVHEQIPLMNGKDSPFGKVVENIWSQIEPRVSAETIKRKGDEVRPKLEALTRAFKPAQL